MIFKKPHFKVSGSEMEVFKFICPSSDSTSSLVHLLFISCSSLVHLLFISCSSDSTSSVLHLTNAFPCGIGNRAITWDTRILQFLVCFPTLVWRTSCQRKSEVRGVWRCGVHYHHTLVVHYYHILVLACHNAMAASSLLGTTGRGTSKCDKCKLKLTQSS